MSDFKFFSSEHKNQGLKFQLPAFLWQVDLSILLQKQPHSSSALLLFLSLFLSQYWKMQQIPWGKQKSTSSVAGPTAQWHCNKWHFWFPGWCMSPLSTACTLCPGTCGWPDSCCYQFHSQPPSMEAQSLDKARSCKASQRLWAPPSTALPPLLSSEFQLASLTLEDRWCTWFPFMRELEGNNRDEASTIVPQIFLEAISYCSFIEVGTSSVNCSWAKL